MEIQRPTLTIGILSLNEATRIQRCVECARFADEIIVIDSGSSDDTVSIARQLGVKIIEASDWQGFAVQRNRLLAEVKTNYVFFLDADEVITEPLAQEILASMQSKIDIGKIIWQEIAFGKPLKYFKNTSGVPRLFKTNLLDKFVGLVHETYELKPNLAQAILTQTYRTPLKHYSRESVLACIRKLVQYTQLGALKRSQQGKKGGILRGAASALAIFFKLYILRRGFLNGGPGFLFCFFVALECFLRYCALGYDSFTSNSPATRSANIH